jgi:hypothetical protein
MTGQVKEEILLRLGELGVLVRGGRISFRPRLLRRAEFLAEPAVFEPLGLDGARHRLDLPAGALAFTLCQVPVVYRLAGPGRAPGIVITEAGGRRVEVPGDTLDAAHAGAVFDRTGAIRLVEVWTTPGR